MPLELLYKLAGKIRTATINAIYGKRFVRFGMCSKLMGVKHIQFGRKVSIGDFCWVEAVGRYSGKIYSPRLTVGNDVRMSDAVHISCAHRIIIGEGVLIGSRVYIGDHSHGYGPNEANIAPGDRHLCDFGEVAIGERTWIGDGVVVLQGSEIFKDSVIAANSVVRKIKTNRPAMIGGNPATVIKYLDKL